MSYAQNQEDIMLWRALRHVQNGFYIDVGAADPSVLSVTRLFYDHGWSGINLEPNPDYFSSLVRERQRDINLSIGAGASNGSLTFHLIEGTGLSTFEADIAHRHSSDWGMVERTVDVLTLAEICQRHRPEGPIHFLKIDVEGNEGSVLAGADFQRFRPWIILAEATVPGTQEPLYEGWEPILIEQGYSFVWFDGLNRFYVADEKKTELSPAFQMPPNVFDGFYSYPDLTQHLRALESTRQADAQSFQKLLTLTQQMTAQLAQQSQRADEAQQRCNELEARLAAQGTDIAVASDVLPPVQKGEMLDPYQLQALVPRCLTNEERIMMASRCRDADVMPKVANAGALEHLENGMTVQIMHNGLKVIAGGYCGPWMQELIARCHGHHEPQEEVLFAEVLRHIQPGATMIELGGYWSFYSIWFLSQSRKHRSIVVEADPAHLEVGRVNARLNGCDPLFIHAFVGPTALPPAPFETESSGVVKLRCVSVASLMAECGLDKVDLLHCDAQGVEFKVLESCLELAAAGRLNWLVVSTHSYYISHDPLTHQRCLAILRQAGATILAEHDVQESFSGDGLIVAKFNSVPEAWKSPRLSFNRYSQSLFRNPLYDLAQNTTL